MKIKLAEYSGACYGVQRALNIAKDLLDEGVRASTIGPLIHNPQVVTELESRGIGPIGDLAEVQGDTVVIRSHGITPTLKNEAVSLGFRIVDATCPHVARAQKGAAEFAERGFRVLVIGESGHPEVESLVGYATQNGAKVDVVSSVEDLPSDIEGPIGVVVQTTQTEEALASIVANLDSRSLKTEIKNTICSATRDRQLSAAELAKECDAMIVIGGRNSSNTTRLAEICKVYCDKTFHIESADELNEIDFIDVDVVGVTAGASTPQNQIDDVLSLLSEI